MSMRTAPSLASEESWMRGPAWPSTVLIVTHPYPPLNVEVRTPRLTLFGATDEMLERLIPVVRTGIVDGEPLPFDDPMSLYEDSPTREWRWLRGIWAGRARVDRSFWRLYFVVVVDGEPIGMQDLIGEDFATFGTVTTFSWLAPGHRGQGIGTEMRRAVLQLAFAGMAAQEAMSEAFFDNHASNRVSEALGYQQDGTNWATRRGDPALLRRWKLTRDGWDSIKRNDIELVGVKECLQVLGS
jgi:RimJ/RimL family protein N-acetyltransferase